MTKATNHTVLGVASLSTTMPLVAGVLVVLFVFMKPEASAGFSFFERLLFWAAHIVLGLASILIASRLLRPRLMLGIPLWAGVLVTGIAGAALLAPVYVLLEGLVPAHLVAAPDDWLDTFGARGPVHSVLAEFIEVAPTFVAAWFAVNLPLLLGRSEVGKPPTDRPPGPADAARTTPDAPPANDPASSLFSRLPRALGRDIVLISSDMHYLHVHTTRGKCMLLGALRDAAQELGDAGMLVHRSHWVAHEHVQKLVRSGAGWNCEMSNGMRVPVSRRNRARVTEWYGHSGNVVSLPASRRRVI